MSAISLRAKRIGIDLGTTNIVVWMEGKGIVYREPAIVARNLQDGKIVAIGDEAIQLLEQQPGNVVSSRPLKEGMIADYDTTVALFRNIIKKTTKYSFQRPYLMICTPIGITGIEKRAIIEASLEAGSKETFLLDEPFAGAIGAGLPIYTPTGYFIVDIGGGTTCIAVLSLGGVIASKAIPIAGNKMDEAIRNYIGEKYALAIGSRTAETLKMKSGSADLKAASYYENKEVKGRDVKTGLPRKLTIEARDISEALQPLLQEIIATITSVLEHLPPEIAADIITHGIFLTGGGALLNDIHTVISKAMGISVTVVTNPLDSVVAGIGENLKNIKQLKKHNTY
ncbi:rod shape-determining protein [Jeotgalibaca sp. A122]|uniref:rod shape-determining protein n=1 Tax=Jeotgalibaca sp. A122 TaxID=3457322 RepID=UPI003FD45D68